MDKLTVETLQEMYNMIKKNSNEIKLLKLAVVDLQKQVTEVHTQAAEQIIDLLASAYPRPVSHSVILRKVYRKLKRGAQEFSQIIDILKLNGIIIGMLTDRGVFYRLRDTN